jgi:hypothetical protein
MLRVAFFFRGRIRSETVGIDAQRPISLIFGVPTGDVRDDRSAWEISLRDPADGLV